MRKQLNKISITIILILILVSIFFVSYASASGLEAGFVQNLEIKKILNIDMDKNPNQTLIIEEKDGVVVGYLEDNPDKIYTITSDLAINVNYPKNRSDSFNLNIQLDNVGEASVGKIQAEMSDHNSIGVINLLGEGKLHITKPANFGLNTVVLKGSQILSDDIELRINNLVMEESSVISIIMEFGTGAALTVSNLNMAGSKIEIQTQHGDGLLVEGSSAESSEQDFLVKEKSEIMVTSGGNGIKTASNGRNSNYAISDSSINLAGNYNGYNSTGMIFSNNIKLSDSKININKYPNGITGSDISINDSEINISTVQEKISDQFGTGIYLSGGLKMDVSNLKIESPLDIGYQNNVQAIWAKNIDLGDSANIIESYVGPFHVSSSQETDIYFNGGIGSQMSDIENYEIISENSNLVYNEETKKFHSNAQRIQSDEVVFKRTKSVSGEKISLGKVSSHKIIIPISLDSLPPNRVEFNSKNGTEIKSQNVAGGEKLTRPENPKKENFDFVNWYTDESLTEVFDFEKPIKGNTTLYAGWGEEKPKVVFNVGGGSLKNNESNINGELGEIVDIAAFQKGGEHEPTKSGSIFIGWTDESGKIVKNTVSLSAVNIKLEAKWLSYANFLDGLEGKSITAYKGESTEESINSQLVSVVENDVNGEKVEMAVNYQWNTEILTTGGITKAIPYIIDPATNEKIYGTNNKETNIYILNKPYVQARESVTFNPSDKISIDGREWQAVGISELPDFSTKTIGRTNFNVIYNGSNINTFEIGQYDAVFSGHITDLNGDLINVEKNVKADVKETDKTQGIFWGKISEELKKLRKNKFYTSDSIINDKKETVKIQGKSDFDRSIIIRPGGNTIMNPGFLANLARYKKGLVRIDMGDNQWDLYGRNFQDVNTFESINVNVLRVNTMNEVAKSLLLDTEYETLHFEMDGLWGGDAVFRTRINFDAEGRTPYMFSWNKDTEELELVGIMTRDNDGYYSIKMNKVIETYVITKDLPKSIVLEDAVMPLPVPVFRITGTTNDIEESSYSKISSILSNEGADIKNITLVRPTFTDLDAQIDQAMKDRQIVAGILIFLSFILTLIVIVNRIIKRRRRKIYSNENFIGIKELLDSETPQISNERIIFDYRKTQEEFMTLPEEVDLDSEIEQEEIQKEVAKKDPDIFYNSALLNLSPKYLKEKIREKKEEALKEKKLEEELSNLEYKEKINAKEEDTINPNIKLVNGHDEEDGTRYIINPNDAVVENTSKSILAMIQNEFKKKTEELQNDTLKEEKQIEEPKEIEETFKISKEEEILKPEIKGKKSKIIEDVVSFSKPIKNAEFFKTKGIYEKPKTERTEEKETKKQIDGKREILNRREETPIMTSAIDPATPSNIPISDELQDETLEKEVSKKIYDTLLETQKELEENKISYSFKARIVKEKEEKPKVIKRRTRLNFPKEDDEKESLADEIEKAEKIRKQKLEAKEKYLPESVEIKEVRENFFKKTLEEEKKLKDMYSTQEFEKVRNQEYTLDKRVFSDLGHQILSTKKQIISREKAAEVNSKESIDDFRSNTLAGRTDFSKKRTGWSTRTKSEVWGSYGDQSEKRQNEDIEMFLIDEN